MGVSGEVASGVRVGVLGPLRLLVDGEDVNPGGPVPRALVARLVLAGGTTVTDAAIIDDLWGEDPPPSASTALQAYVSRLRKVLEPRRAPGAPATVLLRRGPGYALALGEDAVDAVRFERLAARARPLVEDDPRAAVALLDEALALWRGSAYVDTDERGFARPEAQRLHELRTAAVEHRLAALVHAGELAEAVTGLEAFVAVHPLRERAWELWALALYRQHRQADALDVLARLREVLAEELGTDPGPAAAALQAAVLAQDASLLGTPAAVAGPAPEPLRRSHNIPARLSSLVGRREEVADVEALLGQHRLVTLLGTGGAGKTRLALELSRARLDRGAGDGDEDGPWLVELADVRDAALLPQTVATALGLAGAADPASLAAVVGGRRLLLVLDDCEHVVTGVAELVEALLSACPGVRVLATSREPLAVEGEVGYDVPPLSVGADGDAVALFLARAAASAPRWRPRDGDLAHVEELCAALDGLPLALELAAAQLRALSLEQVVEMLDDRFSLLRGGRRTASRHATMLAAVEWSFDVLDDDERAVFCDLSVFDGGFTLAAAREVLGRADVVVLLADLVAKSLVVAPAPGGRRRYRLLETLRQFGAARLDPARTTELRARHVAWVVGVADRADALLRGRVSLAATSELHEESANIRAAVRRAGAADALRIGAGFYWFWYREGLVAEGLGQLLPALAAVAADPDGPPGHSVRARAALGATLLSYLAGDLAGVGAHLQLAGAEAALSDDPAAQAQVLCTVAYFEARSGQVAEATAHTQVAAAIIEAGGGPSARAELLMVEGVTLRAGGSPAAAVARLEEAVAAADAAGYDWVAISSRWNQAKAEITQERWEAARTAALDSLHRCAVASETTSWLVALATLSHIAHRTGDDDGAAELAGAVAWIGGRIGFSPSMMDPDLERYAAELVADLPPEVFAAAADRGRSVSPSQLTERLLRPSPAGAHRA